MRWAGLSIIALEKAVKYFTLLHLLERTKSQKSGKPWDRPGFWWPSLDKSFSWINLSNLAVLKSPKIDNAAAKWVGTRHYYLDEGVKHWRLVHLLWSNIHEFRLWGQISEKCIFLGCILEKWSLSSKYKGFPKKLWTPPKSTFSGLLIAANSTFDHHDKRKHPIWRNSSATRNCTKSQVSIAPW